MTFKIWDGSSFRDPTFVRRWNGSAWVDVGQVSKWNGSAWEQVWPLTAPLSAIISPTAVVAFLENSPASNLPSTRNLTTDSTTVTPSGGSGSYSYSWARVSGDTFTINSPSSATTTFSRTMSLNTTADAVYRCTVTDTVTSEVVTRDVSVGAQYLSGFL